MTDTTITPTWRITWRGNTWTESDLLGRHLAVLAMINGRDDFTSIEIDPTQGHQRLMQMITAFVAVEAAESLGDDQDADAVAMTVAVALKEIADATVDEILGALTYE